MKQSTILRNQSLFYTPSKVSNSKHCSNEKSYKLQKNVKLRVTNSLESNENVNMDTRSDEINVNNTVIGIKGNGDSYNGNSEIIPKTNIDGRQFSRLGDIKIAVGRDVVCKPKNGGNRKEFANSTSNNHQNEEKTYTSNKTASRKYNFATRDKNQIIMKLNEGDIIVHGQQPIISHDALSAGEEYLKKKLRRSTDKDETVDHHNLHFTEPGTTDGKVLYMLQDRSSTIKNDDQKKCTSDNGDLSRNDDQKKLGHDNEHTKSIKSAKKQPIGTLRQSIETVSLPRLNRQTALVAGQRPNKPVSEPTSAKKSSYPRWYEKTIDTARYGRVYQVAQTARIIKQWLAIRDMYYTLLFAKSRQFPDLLPYKEESTKIEETIQELIEAIYGYGKQITKNGNQRRERNMKQEATGERKQQIVRKPHADFYVTYNYQKLTKKREIDAATRIQKTFRGWKTRNELARLSRLAERNDKSLKESIREYGDLVERVQRRHGVRTPSQSIKIKHVEDYIRSKSEYQHMYENIAGDSELQASKISSYLSDCKLDGTTEESNEIYRRILQENVDKTDIIFAINCRESDGPVNFQSRRDMAKKIVSGIDTGDDRVRIGVVPFSDKAYTAVGIKDSTIGSYLHQTFDALEYKTGTTRPEKAIQKMSSMLQDARPGVKKICILITDGKSDDATLTKRLAQRLQTDSTSVYAVGIGKDIKYDELRAIASGVDKVYTARTQSDVLKVQSEIQRKLKFEIAPKDAYIRDRSKPISRRLSRADALEVLWTLNPPKGARIKRSSIRPTLFSKPIPIGSWTIDPNFIGTTDFRRCWSLVLKSRLAREGFISIPDDADDSVEMVTSYKEALIKTEKYFKNNKHFMKKYLQ